MATGLALPVGVDGGGGAVTSSGDVNDRQVIGIALGDDDNDNAFQQGITLGQFMIFQINSEVTDSQVLRRVRAIFRDFQQAQRFKLIKALIEPQETEAERILSITYLSIESDEEATARTAITGSGFRLLNETGA